MRSAILAIVLVCVAATSLLGAEQKRLSLKATGTASDIQKDKAVQENAEFLLVNQTTGWLTLTVDDIQSCSAPAGDHCVTLVSIGSHRVKAQTPDGRNVTNTVVVPAGGFTWTITEE